MARKIVKVTTLGTTNTRNGYMRRLVRFDVIDPSNLGEYELYGVSLCNPVIVHWESGYLGEDGWRSLEAVKAAADRFVFVNGPVYFISPSDWNKRAKGAGVGPVVRADGDPTGAALVAALDS